MMKQITENINASPEENDIIDELTSIIVGWGENSEKQDILKIIQNYTNGKSLDEEVKALGSVNWDKYRESGFDGKSSDYREEMVFTDKTFYSIVELLVKEKELEEWEQMNGQNDSYFETDRKKAIEPITKLFGKSVSASAGPESMLHKIYWAVIDNYEDIESGDIDEFKYLTLRQPVSYTLDLSEDITERKTYSWSVKVVSYDIKDAEGKVYGNEDGIYDPWDYNYEIDNEEVDYKDGINIDRIQKDTVQESYTYSGTGDCEPNEKVIGKLEKHIKRIKEIMKPN